MVRHNMASVALVEIHADLYYCYKAMTVLCFIQKFCYEVYTKLINASIPIAGHQSYNMSNEHFYLGYVVIVIRCYVMCFFASFFKYQQSNMVRRLVVNVTQQQVHITLRKWLLHGDDYDDYYYDSTYVCAFLCSCQELWDCQILVTLAS